MMPKYLEQLERVRRMLKRIEDQHRPPEEYVDDMWSFFQNCWHLKDWVKHDEKGIPDAARKSIVSCVHRSQPLKISGDLANGSKHLRLDNPKLGAGAKYSHDSIEITPGSGKPAKVMGIINTGNGNQRDGLELARECLSEWERIFTDKSQKIS